MLWIILITLVIGIIIIFPSRKIRTYNNNFIDNNSIEKKIEYIDIIDELPKYPLIFEKSIVILDDKIIKYSKEKLKVGKELKIDVVLDKIRFKYGNKILLIDNKNKYLDLINLFDFNHYFEIIKITDEINNYVIHFGCFSDNQYKIFNTHHLSTLKFEPIIGYNYYCIDSVTGSFIKERKEYILNNCKEGDELSIIAEPTNQYDSNALQIIHNNTLIGYVVKRRNIKISKALMKGYKMYLYGLLYDNSKDYLDVSYILYTKK